MDKTGWIKELEDYVKEDDVKEGDEYVLTQKEALEIADLLKEDNNAPT